MIKPEFWDDEILARATSLQSRLLFIGMWNYADDYGVVKGNPIWLKSRVFPYDEISMAKFTEWLGELESGRWIVPFESEGARYYYVRNFRKHQVINRPSQTRNPEPPQQILEDSLSTHGVLTAEIEVEVKEKEKSVRRKRQQKLTDEEFLSALKSKPAFEGIDVDREIAKCEAWCFTNNRSFSRRRITNWLNRVERPMTTQGTQETLGLSSAARDRIREIEERENGR